MKNNPKYITTVHFRDNISKVLINSKYGNKEIIITRRDKPLVKITFLNDIENEHVSSVYARNNMAEVINIVAYGKRDIIITKQKKPLARLTAI